MTRIPPHMTRFARQLRREATPAERKLWRLLSPYQPRVTRQLVFGPTIIDIAHRQARLAIELDGSQHVDNAADRHRTELLERFGWQVMRFWNNDVLSNAEGVAVTILATMVQRLAQPTPLQIGSSGVELEPTPDPSLTQGGEKRHLPQPRTLGSSHE